MPTVPIHLASPAAPSVVLNAGTVAANATLASTHNPGAAVLVFNGGTAVAYFAITGTVDVNTGFPVASLDTAGPIYLEDIANPVTISAITAAGASALRLTVVRP